MGTNPRRIRLNLRSKKSLARIKATPHLRLQNRLRIALQGSLIWLGIA